VYLNDDYFDVEKVVGHRRDAQGSFMYRLRWAGYGAADDTWAYFSDMNAACAQAALDYVRDNLTEGEEDDDQGTEEGEQESEEGPTSAPGTAAPTETAQEGHPPAAPNARDQRAAERNARMGAAEEPPKPSRAMKELD
jgi:hypothetical protein